MKPFIKWVGGKTQLLDVIIPLMPKKYKRYIEPFVGGGALLLHLEPKEALINDINFELITTYKVIRDKPKDLLQYLEQKVSEHNEAEMARNFYNFIREQEMSNLDDLSIATRFIYLNKTSFNGLYRVNSKGKFNVSFNGKKEINNNVLFNKNNILDISLFLQNIKIYNEDFEKIIDKSNKGDFIFVDSPYDDTFNSYNSKKFDKLELLRVHKSLLRANDKGVKWMMTNNNTDFIKKIYEDFKCFEVLFNRCINMNGRKRLKSAKELIVINY